MTNAVLDDGGWGIWLVVAGALMLLLVATGTLQRPIEQALRTRWPTFNYDAQSVLTWGVVTLGTLTMVLFLLMVFVRA